MRIEPRQVLKTLTEKMTVYIATQGDKRALGYTHSEAITNLINDIESDKRFRALYDNRA